MYPHTRACENARTRQVDNAGEVCTACKHYISMSHRKVWVRAWVRACVVSLSDCHQPIR